MSEEMWKDIKGYEGLYLVSDHGRVMSLPRADRYGRVACGRMLDIRTCSNGYLFVGLSKDGKVRQHRIHRLVAKAFVPNPYGYNEVNHLDGDKENNHADNLEWCTRSQNNKHAIALGLRDLSNMHKAAQRANMRPVAKLVDGEVAAIYPSMSAAGEAVGTNGGCISQAVRTGGKSGGYRWKLA